MWPYQLPNFLVFSFLMPIRCGYKRVACGGVCGCGYEREFVYYCERVLLPRCTVRGLLSCNHTPTG